MALFQVMADVFITSTFRNDWNRQFNLKIAGLLSKNGISCYLPQRDTDQSGDRKRTFQENVAGIQSSKVLIAIGVQTQTANWGFEIGPAFCLKKPVIVLTDVDHPVSLMCEGAASSIIIATQLDDMESFAGDLLASLHRFDV
ncbi:MAG: nucleoside 2-deoxyribosyltransferase [Bdellovibrionales bacterium]